jgi:hypothetical protein
VKHLWDHHVSQVEKVAEGLHRRFWKYATGGRGHSCNSEAWLKDQIEQRIVLLKVKKGDKGDKGNDGKDGVADLDEDDMEAEQYTGKVRDIAEKAAAATGPENKAYNRAVTFTKCMLAMKTSVLRIISEKTVRLAQNMQVGPRIPVGTQR